MADSNADVPSTADTSTLSSSSTSSSSSQAAARRARILAKGAQRMAMLTGEKTREEIEEKNNDNTQSAPVSSTAHSASTVPPSTSSSSSSTLSSAAAEAEIDRALNSLQTKNKEDTSRITTAAAEPHPDPHEFPPHDSTSSSSLHSSTDNDSGTGYARSSLTPSFASPASSTASTLRRRGVSSLASLDPSSLPPSPSYLEEWRRRVVTKGHEVSWLQLVTFVLLITLGYLCGSGRIPSPAAWLVLLEAGVRGYEMLDKKRKKKEERERERGNKQRGGSNATRTTSPPPPPPPPSSSPTDDDIIDVDTDLYRSSTSSFSSLGGVGVGVAPTDPLAAFTRSIQNLPNMQLPPTIAAAMKFFELFSQYLSIMRQVMSDAILFVFTAIMTQALRQVIYGETAAFESN